MQIYIDGAGVSYDSPLPAFNIELAKQALKWATAEKEVEDNGGISRWMQNQWYSEVYVKSPSDSYTSCGTACCIAGWVVQEAGYRPVLGKSADRIIARFRSSGYWSEKPIPVGSAMAVHPETQEEVHVEKFARELLGITPGEADALFAGSNKLDDIERIMKRIAESRGMQW